MRELPTRKDIRLKGWNYANAGYYHVAICIRDRHELLGKVVGTTAPGRPFVELSPLGKCVDKTIQVANKDGVLIDKYVVMPNHIHMIVILMQETDDRGRSSLQQVVRNIKSYVTKWAGFSPWQARFHDRIIRDDADYQRVWQYINENPEKWTDDDYYTISKVGFSNEIL